MFQRKNSVTPDEMLNATFIVTEDMIDIKEESFEYLKFIGIINRFHCKPKKAAKEEIRDDQFNEKIVKVWQ